MKFHGTEPGPRCALDRESILRAALEIVDRDGLDALNMRVVARQLGAGTMSLYHHVRSKEALLDGLAETLLSQIAVPGADAGSWTDRAVGLARSFYEACVRHPNAVPLLVTRAFAGEPALKPCEAALDLLAEAGFPPDRALVAFRTTVAYCLGYVTLGSGGFFSATGTHRDEEALHAKGFDRLAELVPHLDSRDLSDDFDLGLRMVLTGILASVTEPV